MVQAVVNLGENEDRILSIVKGKYGLKNKSDAVNMIIDKYGEQLLEPELRPEYGKEILKINKGKHIKFSSIGELRKVIENV